MLPRYPGESWIAMYHHLLMLRSRLTFDQLVGRQIEYLGGDKAAVQGVEANEESYYLYSTAICGNHIMRAGKHWATFTSSSTFDSSQTVGVVRPLPGWENRGLVRFSPVYDEFYQDLLQGRTDRWEGDVHYCWLNIKYGSCVWSDWTGENKTSDWEGRDDYDEDCTTLGMMLDLDEGTLSLYQNGRRLGTLKSGLRGEYCWTAGLGHKGDLSIRRGFEATA